MLIVGREIGQSVIIGEAVKVTVLQLGSKLRIAIDAPKGFPITQVKQNEIGKSKLKKGARIIGATTQIGEYIKVTVIQTETGLLRFAIDAPREVNIYREELYKGDLFKENQIVQRSLVI
ncbi:carbon storage regulator CsrA [Bacillus niacini]|uniref:Carbon storage regulator CsrA n=1 Tax=Neobacillus niacini TaxID=86668 RepID=A0A852THZ5_9BACI|nr:carbon storage regulator [Neobacillus niacini]NYE06744.1 carbon storage regulator CsrA [Neobacillus niacini]